MSKMNFNGNSAPFRSFVHEGSIDARGIPVKKGKGNPFNISHVDVVTALDKGVRISLPDSGSHMAGVWRNSASVVPEENLAPVDGRNRVFRATPENGFSVHRIKIDNAL